MEFDDPIAGHDGSALVDRLDAAPEEENDEYLTKRKSLRYGRPIIRVVRSGEFDRYRRRMVEPASGLTANSRSCASPATYPSPPSSLPNAI